MTEKTQVILVKICAICLLAILAILLISKAGVVNAEELTVGNNRGVSYILQMCSEKAKAQKKFFKAAYKDSKTLNAGWLYGNTSNKNGCKWSKEFMKLTRPKRVRVHICNSTCFPERGRRCESNECFAGMTAKTASSAILNNDSKTYARIDKVIKTAKSDYKAAKEGTVIDYAVSPCLECTLTKKARKKLMKYVEEKFADIDRTGQNPIRFVDNPLDGNCLAGYLCESHGIPKKGKNGIADNDGEDYDVINQISYWEKNTKAWMVLAWKPCLNGVKKVDTGYTPPFNRTDYCAKDRDAVDFSTFTAENFSTIPNSIVSEADRQNCDSISSTIDFTWKLGDGKKYTVWLAPKQYKKFSKVELWKNGKVIDKSYAQTGYRFGTEYAHDTGSPKRRVYDFRKHWHSYPDNAVLHADRNCWILAKPSLRPSKK